MTESYVVTNPSQDPTWQFRTVAGGVVALVDGAPICAPCSFDEAAGCAIELWSMLMRDGVLTDNH